MCVFYFFLSCQEPPNDNIDTTITLSLDYAGLREVWLKISVEEPSNGWNFQLEREGEVVMTESVKSTDTVVIDTGVNVSTAYQYRVFRLLKGQVADSSDLITVNTMDSTSHEFTFVVDTLGEYGLLRDVFIIDESNVWVVGEIHSGDSTYNAARWDGEKWDLILIGVPGVICEGIYYFNENNIWVATGIVYHWNGVEWERYHLWDMGVLGPNDGGVNKIWGNNDNDIYFVGRKGSIVHYDGVSFTKMESWTEVKLRDVWGTDEHNVWACGYESDLSSGTLIRLTDDGWAPLFEGDYEPFDVPGRYLFSSVWGETTRNLFVAVNGSVYKLPLSISDTSYVTLLDQSGSFIYALRGTSENDLFIVGDYVNLWHYNGSSWHHYEDLYSDHTILYGLAVEKDYVFAVGTTFPTGFNEQAVVYRGIRIN